FIFKRKGFIKNMKKISKKAKAGILSLISILLIIIVAFFSYWAYTSYSIKKFAGLEPHKMELEGDFIKLRGADIYYIEKKATSGQEGLKKETKNIILVHGLGGGVFTFRNNIDAIADSGFNVYAIDLKGFGYSERLLKSDYSHEEQAEILLEFMEEKKIKSATVAGHSMGGRISIIAFDKQPVKFDGLILIDSAGLEENGAPVFASILGQPFVDILYYNIFLNSERFKDFLSSAFYSKDFVNSEVASNYLEPFKVKNTNLAYRYILKGNTPYDIKSALSKINIPVLIVWGQNDGWIDIKNAYAFNNLIAGSSIVIIENAGHVPMEEQAEEFNSAVLSFIYK
ncbi:MAG: alpha/beta hydrolase, partial [Actinobacteria bacterium]|nr:alpha/beta hydrolase [Actinomycetota bacterium]